MTSALIGHTGFVGGNLLRQRSFDACFNSKNIGEIADENFDLVVCCGAPAEKWKANADPERDRESIRRLTTPLEKAKVAKMVLISTVDVFLLPVNAYEDTPTPTEQLHAYGKHRLELERWLTERFDTTVIRLVGLYGPGIKKNIVHDFLKNHETHKIDSRGRFQFYDLARLPADITIAVDHALPLLHLPTEPVSVAEVAHAAFGFEFHNDVSPNPASYDIRTRHAALFGGAGPYIEDKSRELAGLAAFVASERAG